MCVNVELHYWELELEFPVFVSDLSLPNSSQLGSDSTIF